MSYMVTFLPENICVAVSGGTLLEAQVAGSLRPDAPCGGKVPECQRGGYSNRLSGGCLWQLYGSQIRLPDRHDPPSAGKADPAIGNAAGEGAKLCALRRAEFTYSQELARQTEFLELASLPDFQDTYVDALEFEEKEP